MKTQVTWDLMAGKTVKTFADDWLSGQLVIMFDDGTFACITTVDADYHGQSAELRDRQLDLNMWSGDQILELGIMTVDEYGAYIMAKKAHKAEQALQRDKFTYERLKRKFEDAGE